jgi:ribulose-bisphosphate carboxylase small chain
MITQGQFSFLPPLSDAQIAAQIGYALGKGWAVSVEHTDDPHPRNTYWEMSGLPLFDLVDAAAAMREIAACRRAHPDGYVKVNAFDSTPGWETVRLSFLVQRPRSEPGFALWRQETQGRNVRYTVHSYATDRPQGERYAEEAARGGRPGVP